MSLDAQQKVSASHLKRSAYLYVRQSTMRQVLENTESTQRQYALRQRAVALGWPDERVIVIDTDLGQSGASAADREGFQKLVAEVGMGRAGIVLGLEVSRLARNSTDWHRLLEICALSNTLILDEDGVYDPAHFNDRLLLGLKGTMSEAELHVLRARLRGGLLNKARRGELRCRLPIGFVYDEGGRVLLDPDKEVQESVRLFFQTFERTGAVHATIKYFREQGFLFPTRLTAGGKKGDLAWGPLSLNRAAHALHNPWYAGAYVFGRCRWRKQPDGRVRHERLPQEEWHVLIRDAHPGYISWLEYERIEQRLLAAAKTIGFERAAGPPREGPALLQGRVVCGLCGSRMHVHYNTRRSGELVTNYVCAGRTRLFGDPLCQSVLGTGIDAAVGQLLVDAVTPLALELSLAVQAEISARHDEADRLRHRQVERAQYEADRVRQRYMQVDPANRLVADSLEADWNAKLRDLAEAQQSYERQRTADRLSVDEGERQRILALAADFPERLARPEDFATRAQADAGTPHRGRHLDQATRDHRRRPFPRRSVHHPDAAAPSHGAADAGNSRGGAPSDRYAPRRVHRRPGGPHPQRAWPLHGRRGRVRSQRSPVGPFLGQAQKPQGALARSRYADSQAGLRQLRHRPDHARPLARRRAHQGSYLQRPG